MRILSALLMLSFLTACGGSRYPIDPTVYSELHAMKKNAVTSVMDVYIVPATNEIYDTGGTDYIFAGVAPGKHQKHELYKNLRCAAGIHARDNGYDAYRKEALEESYSQNLKLIYIVSMFNEPLPDDAKSYNQLLNYCKT